MMKTYWVPQYRWQLQEWIEQWFQRVGNPLPKGLRKKRKRQLYAIYFQIMDRQMDGRRILSSFN